jgi:hypothetical protein
MTRSRQRINPFNSGTPEHTLFARHRKAILELAKVEEEMAALQGRRAIAEGQADAWANALRGLGHGDKIPGQQQLPDYSKGEPTP